MNIYLRELNPVGKDNALIYARFEVQTPPQKKSEYL